MKYIKLTQGQVALVDDDDYDSLNAHKWFAAWSKDVQSFYAMRNSPTANGKRRTIRMHIDIMSAKMGDYVDHINHNTLDNRRENLRVCSGSQNRANRRMQVNNTSGFKGVNWLKERGKWQARSRINGKRRHIGLFATALEAAIAYDRAAKDEFGEFALTNQMLGLTPENKEEQ